jgi:hypothetical protein
MSSSERCTWVETARVEAILGSMRLSMKSLRSGLACYVAFVGRLILLGAWCGLCLCVAVPDATRPNTTMYFPPSLSTLLAWSVLFRSKGTLTNYFGYVKTGCMLVGVSTKVRLDSVRANVVPRGACALPGLRRARTRESKSRCC